MVVKGRMGKRAICNRKGFIQVKGPMEVKGPTEVNIMHGGGATVTGMGTRRKSSRPRRDRDETETRPRRDVKISRRDVCSSRRDRDVTVQALLIVITGIDVIFHVHCF